MGTARWKIKPRRVAASEFQIRGLNQFLGKFLQKSIDILLRVQLKGAPSLALTCSAAGELTTGKNKKSGKNRKKC
jgi:hypothetical protein